MNSITVEVVAFFCILGGAACGMALRKILPPEHLSGDSRNTIQAGIGLVVTMTALILGLLVASAKSTYDTEGAELTRMSANAILLDRMLAAYGPEAKSARDALQLAIVHSADLLDSGGQSGPSLRPVTADADVFTRIEELSPRDDAQRFLKEQASKQAITIRSNTLALTPAVGYIRGFHAAADHADLLARDHLCKLRDVHSGQCNCDPLHDCLCVIGDFCDLVDLGDVHTL